MHLDFESIQERPQNAKADIISKLKRSFKFF